MSCLVLFLFQAGFVSALEINYPTLPGGAQPPQDFLATAPPEEWVALYIKYFFNFFIWIAGAIAFGMVVWGGITYLISAGKPENLAAAKDRIVAAFFGLMVLLSSYIILNILNPQLLLLPSLQKPAVVPIGTEERAGITSPPNKGRLSTIETEVPFAAIIEDVASTTRMDAIKENANNVLNLAGDLRDQNDELNDVVQDCDCDQTTSETRKICEAKCVTQKCSCDVCGDQRGAIENLEKDNLDTVGKLKEEQTNSAEQIRLLNEELARLERAKNLILECQLWPLESLGESLNTNNLYTNSSWMFMKIRFWDQISAGQDWANFYCPVSGNVWGETVGGTGESSEEASSASEEENTTTEPTLPEEVQKPEACNIEVPIGEIIDRVLRIGKLMIQDLKNLIKLNEDIINAVNEVQQAVSECSSQNCTIVCVIDPYDGHCEKDRCKGDACPWDKIDKKAKKIADLEKQIKDVVEKNSTSTDMGITNLADNVMSKILEDVQKIIREPMKKCYTEINVAQPEEGSGVILSDCESALGALGPKTTGGNIRYCCLDESDFDYCLNQCYVEPGQEKYKPCLQSCLKQKSEELKNAGETDKAEMILNCRHKINFYCCGE